MDTNDGGKETERNVRGGSCEVSCKEEALAGGAQEKGRGTKENRRREIEEEQGKDRAGISVSH